MEFLIEFTCLHKEYCMAVMLRAGGKNFDVDAFLKECPWEPARVWHRGKPAFPRSQPKGRKNKDSGFNVTVSDAGFDEINQQIKDATAFLEDEENMVVIKALRAYPGVEGANLDFGVELPDPKECPIQYYVFPPKLARLAGKLSLHLEFSLYPK